MVEKEKLFGKTLWELQEIVKSNNLKPYVAKQIADWLYKKKTISIEDMSNLSKNDRAKLADHYEIGLLEPTDIQTSADGTKKYLYPANQGKFVEAAYIPEEERATLCVSTQIGCKMGCLFCMTGKQGFQGNLSSGEILNQVHSLPEREKLTNVVYMGMGEPFDNLRAVMRSLEILTADYGYAWSPTRITVSTIGIIPAMRTFIEKSSCHLAISLHSPFEEERKNLMPLEKAYPINDIVNSIRSYDLGGQRRVSFEYIMFKGLNDSEIHINELVKVLSGLRCRINLIRFHPVPGSSLQGSDDKTIENFKNKLNEKGILTTIRKSRGEDIMAACGLLSTKSQIKSKTPENQ